MLKRMLTAILTLAILFTVVSVSSVTAFANEDDPNGNGPAVYNVTNYGAAGDDDSDDWSAIENTLKLANETDPVIVVIPAGTYHLSRSLHIYSNTELRLSEKALIIADFDDSAMLYGAHRGPDGYQCLGDTCTHGGYTQMHDITITGGIWDRNDLQGKGNNSIIAIRHGQNITIKNSTLMHSTGHFINVSGDNYVTIEGVTFRDAVEYTGRSKDFWGDHYIGDPDRFNSVEVIHTDYCHPEGETYDYAKPHDDTPTANVTVRNCVFKNVFSGVGTHHFVATKRAHDYLIENNTAENLRSYLCYGYITDNIIVRNNTITNGGAIGNFHNSTAVVTNNQFIGKSTASLNTVFAHDGSKVTVTDNTMTTPTLAGVSATDSGTRITVDNNTIATPALHGIALQTGAALVSAKNNTITNAKNCGVYLNNSTTSSTGVTGNSISGSGDHSFYQYGGSAIFSGNTVGKSGKTSVRALQGAKLTCSNNTITSAGEFAIYASDNSRLAASSNTISGSGASKPAVKVIDSPSTISGNKISGSAYHGIVVSTSNNTTVSGNTVTSPNGYGIQVQTSKGVTVSNNSVTNTKMNAMQIESSTLTISGNTITGAGDFAIYAKENSAPTISGNTISGSGPSKPAIKVVDSPSVITGNKISASSYHGIVVSTSNNSTVSSNTVTSPGGYGIHIQTSKGVTVSGNTVTNSKMNAMLVEGESASKPGTAVITGNKLSASSASLFDLRLGKYAVGCSIGSNTLAHDRMSVDSTASYSVIISPPVLKSAASAYGGVLFAWNKSAGAAKYRVFRKAGSGSWVKLADTTALSFLDKTAADGVTYSYSVRCISADGKKFTSALSSPVKTVVHHAAPVIKSFSNTAKGTAMAWNGTKGAAKYRVFIKASGKWVKLIDTTAKSYTYTGAKGGYTYTYTVRAISSAGAYLGPYNTAGWSCTFVATPSAPKLANTSSGVKIVFAKSAGAAKYQIYRKTGSGSWAALAVTATNSYVDKTARNGVTYSYTVRCLNKNGKSVSAVNTKGSTIRCKR